MPVSWRGEDVLVLDSEAQATFEEWAAAFDAALADSAHQTGIGVVHDARRLGRVLTTAEARRRIEFVKARCKQKGEFRYAVVVSVGLSTSSLAEYGMGRMGETFAESVGVALRVFRDDLAGAIAWARGGPGGHAPRSSS